MTLTAHFDVIVVGGGNAALCAALSARDAGASVLLLERAPESERGGNSSFAGGNWRVVYHGVDDIKKLAPDLTDDEIANSEFGSYTEENFFDDMARVTQFRTNPDLCEVLVTRSLDTLTWMRAKGVRFMLSYGRQAFKVNGKFRFWGGMIFTVSGGGLGVVDALFAAAQRDGVTISYDSRADRLLCDERGVHGIEFIKRGRRHQVSAKAVILACGSFEANTEWRTRYLGRGWDLAKVRGSRFNTGDGLRMALDAGAQSYGNWAGCHAVSWERYASDCGDKNLFMDYQRHSYPWGIMVNALGKRFVDEGADFRNYTYAKYGHIVLEQPGQFAYQLFDAKVAHLLRREYQGRNVTRIKANTLDELVSKLEDVDRKQLMQTLTEYNAAVQIDVPYDPTVKDGRGTTGLSVPKTNWAQRLDEPPFEAYAVTCGITFAFGGIKATPRAEVVDVSNEPIPGLFAAGEMIGGIFYFNYPGGSGLTSGAVFGKVAGASAAQFAANRN